MLSTTFLEGKPEHRYELCTDSIWPLATAVVTAGTCIGVIFHPWAVPIGCVGFFVCLLLWFWRESEPEFASGGDAPPKDKKKVPPDSLHVKSAEVLEKEGEEKRKEEELAKQECET